MEDEKHRLPELWMRARRDNTLRSRKPLAVHDGSRVISKRRPKVRIIHVFAPEIIKTDVENFRELVQRLTGKPPAEKPYQRTRSHAPRSLWSDCDLDGQEVALDKEESPLVAVDVCSMHAFEAAQLALS